MTTLHTVLAAPSPALREATRRVAARSDVLVVLAEQAVELLERRLRHRPGPGAG